MVFREEVIGDARLILGDCREVELPRDDAAIVSDPPYGIAFVKGSGGSPVSNMAHLPNGGRAFARNEAAIAGDAEPFDPAHLLAWRRVILFGGNHFYARLPDGGTFHVWDKHCGRGTADSFSDAEFFWTSWRRKSELFRYLWKGVLQDGEKGEPKYHVSQKPLALMRFCIGLVDEQTIVDPYMGSGTTGVAAAQLGRSFVGVEIDPAHFATACRRIEQAYRQPRLFAEPAPKPSQMELVP